MGQQSFARAFTPSGRKPRDVDKRTPVSEFGHWLRTQRAEQCLSTCLDFLLYRFAYGEGRIDAGERECLLAADPGMLDRIETIRRSVYAEDVDAFADVVHSVLDVTNLEQRGQLFDLLMVVLSNEGEPGAVESTLLRFLCDAFGLGIAHVIRHRKAANGQSINPLPRADLDDWWTARESDSRLSDTDIDAAERKARRQLGLWLVEPWMKRRSSMRHSASARSPTRHYFQLSHR